MATLQALPFGDLLRRYRRAAGLTQEELAEQAGLSARVISDLERSLKHRPRKDTIRLLSEALQLPLDERAGFEAAARRLGQESPDGNEVELPASPNGEVQQPHIHLPIGSYLSALPPGPLAAREEEVHRLQFALDTVGGGAGQLVLLAGEPGIGKTRLAQEVALQARNRGFLVATGCCYERYQTLSLYPVAEALRHAYAAAPPAIRTQIPLRWPALAFLLADRLGAPSQALPTGSEQQQDFVRAVTDFLVVIAGALPVALLIDDLHWTDQATLDLMQHLAHHTRAHRVLLLGTYRDVDLDKQHPVWRALQDLTRERLVDRITLGRMTVEGTAAMVAASIAETEGVSEFAEFVHRRTRGNPFYIDTMLQALGGHYRLIREIGVGGMGRVFEAVDSRTGERVAAKIMFSRNDADLDALGRFQQEGALLATLEHQNIVKVKGTFMEEHASCIIMELLQGQSLGQLMRRSDAPQNLSLARIKHLVAQVAAALAHAHNTHIIHRDIKPDNVMVEEDDLVKVTDFGIARMLRPTVTVATGFSTGLTLGTPLYMAPEQIEGRKVDRRADIYSLGAMLYHLVTGRPVFEGDDPLTIAFKHVHEAPQPPREVNAVIPADWQALILKALAKDPAERFQSAKAMEETIANLSQDAGPRQWDGRAAVPHGETNAWSASRRRATLSPLLAVGIGGAIVLALAVLLVLRLLPLPSSHGHGARARLTFRQPIAIWGSGPGAAHLRSPSSVALDSHSNLFVASVGDSRIQKLSSQGSILTEWGSQGDAPGQFNNPVGVAPDRQGNVYVADFGNEKVQKFSSTGKWLAWHGPVSQLRPPAGAPIQSIAFNTPQGIGVDAEGHIFVTDMHDNCLAVFTSTLKLLGCWGVPSYTTYGFNQPVGVAVDETGNVYVADEGNTRIVQLSPLEVYGQGVIPVSPLPLFQFLRTWGSNGTGLGQFVSPHGVAVDRRGDIFVVDSETCRIQELSPAGKVLAAWGRPGTRPGELRNPQGIAVDVQGNVYVADTGNNRIQKFAAG